MEEIDRQRKEWIQRRAASIRKTYENYYNAKRINAEKLTWVLGIFVSEEEDAQTDSCFTVSGETGRRELTLRKDLNPAEKQRLILSEIGYYLLYYRRGDFQHQLLFLQLEEPEVSLFVEELA